MMPTEDLFPIRDLCKQYQAEVSFIHALHENGMVKIITLKETEYVDAEMLSEVERFIRLHYELAINFEGLEAIHHLLEKVENLQQELQEAQNQLRVYIEE